MALARVQADRQRPARRPRRHLCDPADDRERDRWLGARERAFRLPRRAADNHGNTYTRPRRRMARSAEQSRSTTSGDHGGRGTPFTVTVGSRGDRALVRSPIEVSGVGAAASRSMPPQTASGIGGAWPGTSRPSSTADVVAAAATSQADLKPDHRRRWSLRPGPRGGDHGPVPAAGGESHLTSAAGPTPARLGRADVGGVVGAARGVQIRGGAGRRRDRAELRLDAGTTTATSAPAAVTIRAATSPTSRARRAGRPKLAARLWRGHRRQPGAARALMARRSSPAPLSRCSSRSDGARSSA